MQQRTCLHTKLNGEPCGCVALTNKPYCYFHTRYYVRNARPSDPNYDLPILEDSRSIILGVRQVIEFYMRGAMDRQQATTLLYAYQIAMSGVSRPDGMAPDAEHGLQKRRAAELFLKLRNLTRPAASKPEPKVEKKAEKEVNQEKNLSELLLANLQQMLREEREAKGLPPQDPPAGDLKTTLESMLEPELNADPDAAERSPSVSSS